MPIIDPLETKPVAPTGIVDPLEEQPGITGPVFEQGEPASLWESAKDMFVDHEAEGARAVQALVDSEMLKIPPNVAYRYRDEIDKGVKKIPQASWQRTTLGERIKQSWDTGVKQNQVGELGYQYVVTGDPKHLEAMQAIKMPTADEELLPEGRLESAVRSAAKLTPMMAETAMESTGKGLSVGMGFGTIAALLGQSGPQLVLPEEVITVPAATALGFKVGATEGAFEASLRKEAGLALSEIINFQDPAGNVIDPNIARATAFGIGSINAALEVAQLRILLNTIPGADKLFSDAIMATAASKTVKDQLLALAGKYAGTVATETGQEVAQESTSIVFEELAKQVSNRLDETDIDPATADDIVNRLLETATESAKGFAVIAAPGIGARAAMVRTPAEAAPAEVTPPAVESTDVEPAVDVTDIEGMTAEQLIAEVEGQPTIEDAEIDAIISAPDADLDTVIDQVIAKIDEVEAPTRLEAFREQVGRVVPDEQADAVTTLLEARATAVGMTADDYIEFHGLEVSTEKAEGEAIGQRTKAEIFFDETKTIIRAFEDADVSSMVHELGHVFRRDLGGADLNVAEEWAGVVDGKWTVPAEEKFARGFERYLAEGVAPSEALRNVFQQFKEWLLQVYQSLRGSSIDIDITPDIQGVFDRLLAEPETAQVLAQKAESVKGRIRRVTGQARDAQAARVSERQALTASFKKAAQAARKAASEGNKEGVATERARMKAIYARATAKRQRAESVRSLKSKIKKELKATKVKKQAGKPVGKFTPEIQTTLDTLRYVSKLTKAEAEAKIAENLETYRDEPPPQEVVIENHLLEMVARYETMTEPDQLQGLLDQIRALKDEGRMINELRRFNRSEVNRIAVEKTVEELGGVPEGVKTVGVKEFAPKTLAEKSKRFAHTIGKTIVGWDDLMDILSFKTKSAPGESFISRNNDLLGTKNVEKRGTRLAMNDINADYGAAYGLESGRQMLKRMHADNTEEIVLRKVPMSKDGRPFEMDLKFTRAELRKRAMELMDESLWETFQEMGYTPDTAAQIFEALTSQDKDYIQRQMAFYQKYYEGVNDVYKSLYGVNLPKNETYSPITREGIAKPVDEGMGEFMREMSFRATAATAGSLKSRVASKLTISKASDISVLQSHISEMEHFKAWAEKVRELNAVWKNPDVRAAVEVHHGIDSLALIDNFIGDFAHGGVRNAHRLKGLDKFRINFTKSALGVSPDITLKQLSSFVAYAEKMPVGQFAKYMAKFWKNPVENSKTILSSELMKERGQNIDRDLKQAMRSEEYSSFAKHQSFINMLMLNVQLGDQGAIVIGGWPYYQWLRDSKGYTHDEAIAAFEKFTEQTQQSGDITEQSYWQRGGTLAKLLTMFMSSPNQYIRKEIAAIRNLAAGRQTTAQTVKTLMIYHAILPMLFQFASDRFTWDEDEQKRALIFGALNGWFIVGDGLDYLLREMLGMRQFDMEIPVYSVFHDTIKAAKLIDLMDLTADEFFKGVRGLAGVVGAVAGLPLKQVVDEAKGLTDTLDGEYEKGLTEMMGYSPYKAEQLSQQ